MKKFLLILASALALFLTSCTKEALIISNSGIKNLVKNRTSTTEIQVSVISSSENSGTLTIEATGTADFEEVELVDNQNLSFSTSTGSVILSFEIDSWELVSGNLEVTFDLGDAHLTGYDLDIVQSIIILDGTIE